MELGIGFGSVAQRDDYVAQLEEAKLAGHKNMRLVAKIPATIWWSMIAVDPQYWHKPENLRRFNIENILAGHVEVGVKRHESDGNAASRKLVRS
jgi:hypothetical protein